MVSSLIALHTGAEFISVQVLTAPCEAGSWPLKQRAMVASATDLDLMMLGVTRLSPFAPASLKGARQPHSACNGTLAVPLPAMMEQFATLQSTKGPLHLGHNDGGAAGLHCRQQSSMVGPGPQAGNSRDTSTAVAILHPHC